MQSPARTGQIVSLALGEARARIWGECDGQSRHQSKARRASARSPKRSPDWAALGPWKRSSGSSPTFNVSAVPAGGNVGGVNEGDQRADQRAERRAARELIGRYHEEQLGLLLEHVREGFVRLDAGESDAFELDKLIHLQAL